MKFDSRYLFAALFFTACAHHALFAQTQSSAKPSKASTTRIPFVGCKSDGQVGPLKAPVGKSRIASMGSGEAILLAYYKAEMGLGVLAPRGWYCFGTYGSNGGSLYVSPEPLIASDLFSSKWSGFSGPVIQLSTEVGGTSGRFGVARIIARVFPSYRKFLTQVIEEDIESASSFPAGPYPSDKLLYKGTNTVEFETPANTNGLGTDSRLKKNAAPIHGVAILMEESDGSMPSSLSLSVRLPPDLTSVTAAIIQQAERDAQQSADTK